MSPFENYIFPRVSRISVHKYLLIFLHIHTDSVSVNYPKISSYRHFNRLSNMPQRKSSKQKASAKMPTKEKPASQTSTTGGITSYFTNYWTGSPSRPDNPSPPRPDNPSPRRPAGDDTTSDDETSSRHSSVDPSHEPEGPLSTSESSAEEAPPPPGRTRSNYVTTDLSGTAASLRSFMPKPSISGSALPNPQTTHTDSPVPPAPSQPQLSPPEHLTPLAKHYKTMDPAKVQASRTCSLVPLEPPRSSSHAYTAVCDRDAWMIPPKIVHDLFPKGGRVLDVCADDVANLGHDIYQSYFVKHGLPRLTTQYCTIAHRPQHHLRAHLNTHSNLYIYPPHFNDRNSDEFTLTKWAYAVADAFRTASADKSAWFIFPTPETNATPETLFLLNYRQVLKALQPYTHSVRTYDMVHFFSPTPSPQDPMAVTQSTRPFALPLVALYITGGRPRYSPLTFLPHISLDKGAKLSNILPTINQPLPQNDLTLRFEFEKQHFDLACDTKRADKACFFKYINRVFGGLEGSVNSLSARFPRMGTNLKFSPHPDWYRFDYQVPHKLAHELFAEVSVHSSFGRQFMCLILEHLPGDYFYVQAKRQTIQEGDVTTLDIVDAIRSSVPSHASLLGLCFKDRNTLLFSVDFSSAAVSDQSDHGLLSKNLFEHGFILFSARTMAMLPFRTGTSPRGTLGGSVSSQVPSFRKTTSSLTEHQALLVACRSLDLTTLRHIAAIPGSYSELQYVDRSDATSASHTALKVTYDTPTSVDIARLTKVNAAYFLSACSEDEAEARITSILQGPLPSDEIERQIRLAKMGVTMGSDLKFTSIRDSLQLSPEPPMVGTT